MDYLVKASVNGVQQRDGIGMSIGSLTLHIFSNALKHLKKGEMKFAVVPVLLEPVHLHIKFLHGVI